MVAVLVAGLRDHGSGRDMRFPRGRIYEIEHGLGVFDNGEHHQPPSLRDAGSGTNEQPNNVAETRALSHYIGRPNGPL